MSLSRLEDTGVLPLLHDGLNQKPHWDRFLRAFQRTSRADGVGLLFCHGVPEVSRAACWQTGETGAPAAAFNGLRLNRVYAFEELELEEPQSAERRFGRVMRVGDGGVWSGWLVITRNESDFTAADSVFLSALAPHLAIALRTFSAMERERLRADLAQDLLARIGVTWRLQEDDGRVIEDANPPGAKKDIEGAIAKLAATEAAILNLPQKEGASPISVLSTSFAAPSLAAPPAAQRAVVIRTPPSMRAQQARRLEQLWSLSPNEARLTAAIANGLSLTEAAESVGLTIETARNYSKRIYAKTGARGLADLVRLALNSVAVLS